MNVSLIGKESGDIANAFIEEANVEALPSKRSGWNFSWKSLGKVEGSTIYKCCKASSPHVVEGLLMLTVMNNEMLIMNNIEVSPENYGREGRYDNVAGLLIAFACYKSFELGRGNYRGFLSFESKTSLIELYIKKYGASYAMGNKMFFSNEAGIKLIQRYLNLNIQ